MDELKRLLVYFFEKIALIYSDKQAALALKTEVKVIAENHFLIPKDIFDLEFAEMRKQYDGRYCKEFLTQLYAMSDEAQKAELRTKFELLMKYMNISTAGVARLIKLTDTKYFPKREDIDKWPRDVADKTKYQNYIAEISRILQGPGGQTGHHSNITIAKMYKALFATQWIEYYNAVYASKDPPPLAASVITDDMLTFIQHTLNIKSTTFIRKANEAITFAVDSS